MTASNLVEYYNEKHKAGFTDSQIAESLGLNVNFLKDFLKGLNDETIPLDTQFELTRPRKIPVISIDYVNRTTTDFSKEFMDWLKENASHTLQMITEETGVGVERFVSTFTCKCLLTDGSTINVHRHVFDDDPIPRPNYDPVYGVCMEAIDENAVDFKVIMPNFVSRNLSSALDIPMEIMTTTLTYETLDDVLTPIMGEITVWPHVEDGELLETPNPLIKSVEIYFDVDQL